MSAAHRFTPDTDHPADAPPLQLEPWTRGTDGSAPTLVPVDHTERTALATEIERTRLRTRVAALERALLAERRRRQTIVDQYERILEDRARCEGDRESESNRSASATERRFDRSPRLKTRTRTQTTSRTGTLDSRDARSTTLDPGPVVRRVLSSVGR